jgi:hypothetical protein
MYTVCEHSNINVSLIEEFSCISYSRAIGWLPEAASSCKEQTIIHSNVNMRMFIILGFPEPKSTENRTKRTRDLASKSRQYSSDL